MRDETTTGETTMTTETMSAETAAEKINATADHTATVRGDRILVTRYGKDAGYVTQDDLDAISHTPTGWGDHLRKGAYPIWRAITGR